MKRVSVPDVEVGGLKAVRLAQAPTLFACYFDKACFLRECFLCHFCGRSLRPLADTSQVRLACPSSRFFPSFCDLNSKFRVQLLGSSVEHEERGGRKSFFFLLERDSLQFSLCDFSATSLPVW